MGIPRRLPPDNPVTRQAQNVGRYLEPGAPAVVKIVPSSQRLLGRKMQLLEGIIDRLHVELTGSDEVSVDLVKKARMAQQMITDIRKDERETEMAPENLSDEEIVAQLAELGVKVEI